ncbi:hypothetical protein SeMB42_g06701 [Synchytrium endobioticum]|uniref:Uncharacterized protein n=1 Tax=Synchytrium endobioticum TaxID=286115 RepID=A0A507CKW2_9FUNG|nr:hypothetical protein SeMB42_g06701 [Synchytrium endobioticum]
MEEPTARGAKCGLFPHIVLHHAENSEYRMNKQATSSVPSLIKRERTSSDQVTPPPSSSSSAIPSKQVSTTNRILLVRKPLAAAEGDNSPPSNYSPKRDFHDGPSSPRNPGTATRKQPALDRTSELESNEGAGESSDGDMVDRTIGTAPNTSSRRRDRRAKRSRDHDNGRRKMNQSRVDHAPTPIFHQTPMILERRVPASLQHVHQQSPPHHPDHSADFIPNYSGVAIPPFQASAPVSDSHSTPAPAQIQKSSRSAAPTPDVLAAAMLKHIKATAQPPCQPILASPPLPTIEKPSINLIDDNWNCIIPTKHLADTPGCFIVGIIGRSHRVVSTLIQHFTQSTPPPAPTATKPIRGVTFHITPERIIVLGAQQIHTSPKVHESSRDYQIAQFLFSVCHVLVVVGDGLIDTEMWDFVKRVESIMSRGRASPAPHQRSDVGSSNASNISQQQRFVADETEFRPEIIFLARRGQFPDDYYAACEEVQNIFNQDTSRFRVQGSNVNMTKFLRRPDENVVHPNVFLLPDSNPRTLFFQPPVSAAAVASIPNQAPKPAHHPTFHEFVEGAFSIPCTTIVLINTLRNSIFEIPRYMMNGTGMLQKWYMVSEKDWGKSATRVWEGILATASASSDIRNGSLSVDIVGAVSGSGQGGPSSRRNDDVGHKVMRRSERDGEHRDREKHQLHPTTLGSGSGYIDDIDRRNRR